MGMVSHDCIVFQGYVADFVYQTAAKRRERKAGTT
jgi:hypothetical protein